MKKILGILLLAVLLVFAAGCVSTPDPILGVWEYSDEEGTITLDIYDERGGITTYTDADGETKLYPTVVIPIEKCAYFEGSAYYIEEFYLLTFEEDGTLTDENGNVYSLEEGADKFGGGWTVYYEPVYYTLVFNEDGTGTLFNIDEEGEESTAIAWQEYGDNQITFQYTREYFYDENGVFSTTSSKEYELVDGVWIAERNGQITAYEFFDNGLAVRTKYDAETNEILSEGWMQWEDKEDGTGGDLYYANTYTAQLQEDGTLLDEWGYVFTRTN